MKKLLIVITVMLGLSVLVFAGLAEAQGVWGGCDPGVSNAICGDETEAEDMAKRIINLFLYAIGILSVIMIIHSGLKYVTSRGDAEQVKSAKNTLLYSVTGLIVALFAFTIVNFVIVSIGQTSPTPAPPAEGQSGPRVD